MSKVEEIKEDWFDKNKVLPNEQELKDEDLLEGSL